MKRLQLKRELKKELARKEEIFRLMKVPGSVLSNFNSAFDLLDTLGSPEVSEKAKDKLLRLLISLYRAYQGNRAYRQVLLAILLLAFWEDMQRLQGEKRCRYWLWRLGEPFAEVYFAYINLIAEGDFNHRLIKGEYIRSILYDQAKEFIKKEYKRQCVYEV